mgnify:CR=1 FL=1
MSNPLPWFKVEVLQVANDLSDVRSLEAEGAYFRVLRHLWLNGPQPIEQLRRKCQHVFDELEHLFNNCSTTVEPLFSIEWLESQRAKCDEWRANKSVAGKKSAEVRSSKPKTKNRRSTVVEQPTSISTSILSKKEEEHAHELEWPGWAGERVKAAWSEFKDYRWSTHRVKYKSATTEQHAVNLLGKYYTTGKDCFDGLNLAMAKGWKFPVDPSELKPTQANGKPTEMTKAEADEALRRLRIEHGIPPGGMIETHLIPKDVLEAIRRP